MHVVSREEPKYHDLAFGVFKLMEAAGREGDVR
jgi:hypothetical protein